MTMVLINMDNNTTVLLEYLHYQTYVIFWHEIFTATGFSRFYFQGSVHHWVFKDHVLLVYCGFCGIVLYLV